MVLLVAHVIYAVWTDIPLRLEAKSILSIVFYVSNWAQANGLQVPGGLIHTWTLSIEEQFYLIWPITLLLMLKFAPSRAWMLSIVGTGIVASAFIRAAIWAWGSGYPAAYLRTDARSDGLLIGVGLALLWRWKMVPLRGLNVAASISLLGLLGVAVLWDSTSPAMFYGGYTVVSLAAAVIILAVVESGWGGKALFENAADARYRTRLLRPLPMARTRPARGRSPVRRSTTRGRRAHRHRDGVGRDVPVVALRRAAVPAVERAPRVQSCDGTTRRRSLDPELASPPCHRSAGDAVAATRPPRSR